MFPFALTTFFLYVYKGASAAPPKTTAFLPVRVQQHRVPSIRTSSSTSSTDDLVLEKPDTAPVYITIGPPCCGKTEALRSYLLSEGYDPDDVFSKDVALDDQSAVYQRIPLAAFLFPSTRLDPKLGKQILKSGATVKERLLDPSYDNTDEEIRNVMLRVAGRMSPPEFAERTREQALRAGDTVKFFRDRRITVAEDLIGAVEQGVIQAVSEVICQMQLKRDAEAGEDDELPYDEEKNEKDSVLDLSTMNATQSHLLSARALIQTPFVEIFVPQAIFNGGIDRAQDVFVELLRSCTSQPVSWGNTNTRPAEYAAALGAAQKAGRPVKFVAWGTTKLPVVSRQELLRRNVSRFRRTGRYIPAGAIGAALGRIEKLVYMAQQKADKLMGDNTCQLQPDEWENHKMDVAFASLAGFRMDDRGFVVQLGEPNRLEKKNRKKAQESWKRSRG